MHKMRLPAHRSRPSTRRSNKPCGHRWPQPRRRKRRRANRSGVKRQLPSNKEMSSSESRGVERKDTVRRLTRARRARAFNALVAFQHNTLVTGSVLGNRHPSRHSFCSLPHLTTQRMSGRRKPGWKPGWNVKSGPPRDAKSQNST